MTGAALFRHQFRYDQKAFWRNPASVFFTVMFPVVLLVIFGYGMTNDLDRVGLAVIDQDHSAASRNASS